MELKKLKKQDWSTSTYSGEVPEETLEGQGYEFMTVYDTTVSMGDDRHGFTVVVEGNGDTNDKLI